MFYTAPKYILIGQEVITVIRQNTVKRFMVHRVHCIAKGTRDRLCLNAPEHRRINQ